MLVGSGRRLCPPAQLLTIRQDATERSLAGIPPGAHAEPAAPLQRRVVETLDATGRALFAGYRSLPWPADPLGAVWRACETLRERRGDSHLVAYTALGLRPLDMHCLLELWLGTPPGSHAAIYGWSPYEIAASYARLEACGLAAAGALRAAGVELREGLEARTGGRGP